MRIHRTQNSCFAQFTQQISSVSTEQYQAGVKSSLNGLRIKKSRLRKSSQQKRTSSYWKMWSRKKWILRCNPQGATIGNLDTDGENVFRVLKHWRKKSNVREFVKMRHSREESLLLQNCSWRKWWFWRPNRSMQRIHTSLRRSKFKNLCNDSRTNFLWSSSSSSYRTISWHQRNWNSDSSHNNERSNFLGCDMPRWKPQRGGVTSQRSRPQSHKFWIAGAHWIVTILLQKKENLVRQRWRRHGAYSEEVIPVGERKWNDILACQHFRGHSFEAEASKLSWDWYVVMIKTKGKQTELFIGIRWVQNCEKRSRRLEGTNFRTLIGFRKFTKEATKRGSGIARIPETSYCTFVVFKDTLVGTW